MISPEWVVMAMSDFRENTPLIKTQDGEASVVPSLQEVE
jgi:hypothetical protein